MADIEHAIQIAAMPETIYPLVATANGFGQWWATDISEPPGGVELAFFNRATVYRLKLEIDKPGTQAGWLCESGREWGGTRIAFRLEARGSATFLRFSHSGWQAATDYFVSCNTTRGEAIFHLKSAAEGKPRGPLFLAGDLAY